MQNTWPEERFSTLETLVESGSRRLVHVRDLATDRNRWLLTPTGRGGGRSVTAVHLRVLQLRQLRVLAGGVEEVEVFAHPEGLAVSLGAATGVEAVDPQVLGENTPEFEDFVGALGHWASTGIPLSRVEAADLVRIEGHLRLLPTAWLFPPSGRHPVPHTDAAMVRTQWQTWRQILPALPEAPPRSEVERGADASLVAIARQAVERGGTVVVESADPARAAQAWGRALESVGMPPVRMLADVDCGGKDVAGRPLLLEDVRSLLDLAAGWALLDDAPLCVLTTGGSSEDALRLWLAARESRAPVVRYRWEGPPAPEEVEEEEGPPEESAAPLAEILDAAGEALPEEILLRATGIEPEALARAIADGQRAGRLRVYHARHATRRSSQLLVVPARKSPPEALAENRRRELEHLLATVIVGSRLRSRSMAALWLQARWARRALPDKAPGLMRRLARRAEKSGAGLLAHAAWEQFLESSPPLEATVEDLGEGALCREEQYRLRGELDHARVLLDRALASLRAADPEGRYAVPLAELVLRQVQLDAHRSGFGEAEGKLSALLDRSKDRLPVDLRARVYLDLAWAQLQLGRSRESIGTIELVLRILDAHSYPAIVARAHNQLGFALYRESEYAGSIVHYERALRLREQVGDKLAVARTYNNLGLSHRALGQLNEARRCLQEGLEHKRRVGDDLSVAASLLNLGFVEVDAGELERATECAEECMRIARQWEHPETEAEAWGLLGEIAQCQGQLDRAEEFLRLDLGLCETSGHEAERLATLRRLVSVLLQADRSEEAAETLEEAREALRRQPSRYEAAMLDRLEGELLGASGALEPALDAYAAAARGFAAARRFQAQLDALARKALLELDLGMVEAARTTGIEIEDLIAHHEIHRPPASVLEYRRRRVELPHASAPLAEDRGLTLLGELTAEGPPEAERLLQALGAALPLISAELFRPSEVGLRWEDGRVRRVRAAAAIGSEMAELHSGELRVEDEEGWARLAPDGRGWLHLRWIRPLQASERSFLQTVVALLATAPSMLRTEGVSDPVVAPPLVEDDEEERMIGRSPAFRRVLRTLDQVAATDVIVLVLGENGTGKELVARAIHRRGRRAAGPFVAVNCASIPDNLLESELFGHERGAFTSAYERRIGRFEQARGGTLFLDEIAEMPLEMQTKLLRVLQERSFTRVGGSQTLHTDARIVAATNRDLVREVEEGRFRTDLFYRLNVVTIELPPLRERVEDIEPLLAWFLAKHAETTGAGVRSVTQDALARLERYHWPGNVRELENLVKSALVFARDDRIRLEDLPAHIAHPRDEHRQDLREMARQLVERGDWSEESPLLPRLELLLTHELVARVGNKTRAARMLGITKPTLYDRLRRYEALYGGEGADRASG